MSKVTINVYNAINIRATEHCFETMVLFTDSTSTIPALYHIIILVHILPVTHTTDQKNIQLCISNGYIPYTIPFTPFQWIWPPRSPSFTINLKSLWKVEPTETKTFKARPLPFPSFGQTPPHPPGQGLPGLLTKQQSCWLGVSIAALRRLYLLWSAATYPGSFTTPMQCQLIAVTSCNY